jgi:cephalosporin hydroxylase
MYTKKEFESLLAESAKAMTKNKELIKEARILMSKANDYRWIHQTKWLNETCIQLPQDLFAIQEIICNTKPRFIIEVGVAWGGAILFYSSVIQVLGYDAEIIGIDVYIPDDLKERIFSHQDLSRRIHLINRSSVDLQTVDEVRSMVGPGKNNFVHLDSNHTHNHVLAELELYSQFIGKNYYLLCADTLVDYLPPPPDRPREWGPGNNPKTALDAFMQKNKRFMVDQNLEDKLLLTCNPGGYLKCMTD